MNRLPDKPIVYLITKGDADSANFYQIRNEIHHNISVAVEVGIALIQIREKNLPSGLLFGLVNDAAAVTRDSGTRLLVNGRADIALAAGADGVHLPADGLPADIVRQTFPAEFLIGVSTHSADEAIGAKSNEADFITYGPVFESPGKGPPTGLEMLNKVCEYVEPFPVIALGGIDESNYGGVLVSGASGFAAIRFLNDEFRLRKLSRPSSD